MSFCPGHCHARFHDYQLQYHDASLIGSHAHHLSPQTALSCSHDGILIHRLVCITPHSPPRLPVAAVAFYAQHYSGDHRFISLPRQFASSPRRFCQYSSNIYPRPGITTSWRLAAGSRIGIDQHRVGAHSHTCDYAFNIAAIPVLPHLRSPLRSSTRKPSKLFIYVLN